MLDVCDECGISVSKRLLHCRDDAAVYHRECVNGHKQHRVIRRPREQTDDAEAGEPSPAFVIVESCDCN